MKLTYPFNCKIANFFLNLSDIYQKEKEDSKTLDKLTKIISKNYFEKPVDLCKKTKKIVSFEGINGSLKSTILKKIINLNQEAKILRYRLDETNEFPLLNCKINKYIANSKSKKEIFIKKDNISLITQTLLLASYEAFVWEKLSLNLNNLNIPKYILVDRMHDSSIIIQGYLLEKKGINIETSLKFMENIYEKFGQPSVTVLLDFPVESCIERIKLREKDKPFERDREENKELNLLSNLYFLQQKLVKKNQMNYFSVNHPSMEILWKDKPHTNYPLEEICMKINEEIIR